MITEDYVSFETAKLLKEKGFDEYCRTIYNVGVFCSVASLDCRWNEGYGELIEEKQNSDFGIYDNAISAPTLQMAMKWLREVHNIHINIDIHWLYFANQNGWMYIITKILENGIDYVDSKGDENDKHFYSTYEEACEAAIKYCLENLI